ncbi:MAG TPA: GNAT family N-acetyltransferase [Paucimonas sp.]|nr:GNAT family N-acetyltransferase [Paucimonas sp.]
MHAVISCAGPAGPAASPEASDAGAAPLPRLLDELQEGDWKPAALAACLPALTRHADALAPSERTAWIVGLARAWERHGWALNASARAALLELAAAWAAWPLAAAVGAALRGEGRLDGAGALHLMDAWTSLGEVDAALDLAVAMQLAQPARQTYAAAYRNLDAWRRWRDSNAPLRGIRPEDEELRLEPLGHHHAPDFGWQYYDPAIAELCCLPDFPGAGEWHRWLDRIYSHGDQAIFAVVHRRWGFIGCVSLILRGDIGFFYYWIGRDFQGCGFGPRAAALMLDDAYRHAGMRCCYAKVYDYNLASRKALEKIGFEDLGICAAAPDDDQLFYRLGEPQASARTAAELHALMDYLGSDIRVAVPLAPTHYQGAS